jgi:hypothetical protein
VIGIGTKGSGTLTGQIHCISLFIQEAGTKQVGCCALVEVFRGKDLWLQKDHGKARD